MEKQQYDPCNSLSNDGQKQRNFDTNTKLGILICHIDPKTQKYRSLATIKNKETKKITGLNTDFLSELED